MPSLDREAVLKTAEKFLRQGKLDAAIAEYQKVVDDQPRDWTTANTLGDLLLRAGKTDKAVAQYARIADQFATEGFYPKASALYKKIIKIKPDDEPALMNAAEISAKQGLVAEAKLYLTTVADRRKARGDRRGTAEIRVRLGELDPSDLEARVAGGRASAELGQTLDAARVFRETAEEYADRGDRARALDLLQEAGALNPADQQVRRMLVQAYLATGDLENVRRIAQTAPKLKQIALHLKEHGQQDTALLLLADILKIDPSDDETRMEVMRAYIAAGHLDRAMALAPNSGWLRELASELMLRGQADKSLDVLAEAWKQDPSDEALRTELARAFVRRGDRARAAEYLTRAAAGDDPALLLNYGELELRRGHVADGLDAVKAALEKDPGRRDDVVQLGWQLCDVDNDVAFQIVDLAAVRAVAASDWGGAAAALHEFVTRVPHHLPALMKLVEICVDGGLEATMYEAQAQLADAYLAAGLGSEARVIAEDLVAREPWERANIERFRRSLILLGEPDPDAVIADRLSGQSPFMSTDVGKRAGDDEFAMPEAPPAPPAPPTPARAARPEERQAEERTFELGPVAIDWTSILGEDESASGGRGDSMEIDLSDVLGDLRPLDPVSAQRGAGGGAMDQKPKQPGDLDAVFQEFRDEVSRQTALDAADQQFKLGQTYREMGMIDEAIAELQKAARSPRRRFEAASIVARIYRDRGDMAHAIDWFERAAEAPAPTADSGRALLYDLATALESQNESARALAVYLELQADAGDYRDTRARVDKLTKAQKG